MSRVTRKLFLLAAAGAMLSGCADMDFPRKLDFNSNWVSRDGKSQEQFYRDQGECKRETLLVNPPAFPSQAGVDGSNWDMSNIKEFESCMRSKGWAKE